METGLIPPTINLDDPDPECDLDYVPLAARETKVRTALCNCIGFGSKNSALVIRRVYHMEASCKRQFMLEFWLPIKSDYTLLFPASDFVAAVEVPVASAA